MVAIREALENVKWLATRGIPIFDHVFLTKFLNSNFFRSEKQRKRSRYRLIQRKKDILHRELRDTVPQVATEISPPLLTVSRFRPKGVQTSLSNCHYSPCQIVPELSSLALSIARSHLFRLYLNLVPNVYKFSVRLSWYPPDRLLQSYPHSLSLFLTLVPDVYTV